MVGIVKAVQSVLNYVLIESIDLTHCLRTRDLGAKLLSSLPTTTIIVLRRLRVVRRWGG